MPIEMIEEFDQGTQIKVIGVGGGGGNAVDHMIAQPRAATVMGQLEEARLARLRGMKVAQKSGSMKTAFSRFKDFIVGNF